MESITKYKNVFKWISFCILLLVTITTLIALSWKGINSESVIPDTIYSINCFLCVVSIIVACLYLFAMYLSKSTTTYGNYNKKIKTEKKDLKKILKRIWPCILLIVFLAWTAIGCIQASMEAAAEATLKDEILENDTERNKEIAAWTSGDRMANAADRAWNGCDNLKDGYFSFLFYAMVALNVVMLGSKSDNLKKIILRVLLISGLILVLFSFLQLLDPVYMSGIVSYKRAIFNNSNHYGYYLCIITMLCATMFVKDKNIYFKCISLLGFALTSFMLIVNNTFGAYLGVMVALAVIFVFSLVKGILEIYLKKENYFNSLYDFARVLTLTIIFAFFSFTIISAESIYSANEQYYMQKSHIGFSFAQRDNVLVITSNQATMRNTSYTKSGDNRVYKTDKKTFKLVESLDEYDATAKYYTIEGFIYELVDEEVTFEEKTPESFPKTTIVETNFKQLGKDIGIIFNHFEKTEKNENIEKLETTNQASGEENKSGLSDEVSNTGSGRGEVWLKSLDLIAQRPVFGWGLENLLNEFYYQYGINEGRTHNLILQLAGTTGIFGVLFYMVAVIAIFFKVVRNYKKWGLIEYITIPTFIAYMVSSMFGNSAFYTSPYFMIILGMMIASMIYKEKIK